MTGREWRHSSCNERDKFAVFTHRALGSCILRSCPFGSEAGAAFLLAAGKWAIDSSLCGFSYEI